MSIIKGWGLAPRPAASAVMPNTIYIDLDGGKIYVVEGGEWREPSNTEKQELPDYTVATQGKFLAVDNAGKLAWESLPAAPVAANQLDSEATTIAALKADFNTLLAALKTAGMMLPDPPAPPTPPETE